MEHLSGTVSRVRFESDRFSVVSVKTAEHGEIAFVGKFCRVTSGDVVAATGSYKNDPKFGRQFSVETLSLSSPATTEGLIKFLSGERFRGIGVKRATQVVSTFGSETIAILEKEPHRLVEAGLSHLDAKNLVDTWNAKSSENKIVAELVSLGVGPVLAGKLYAMYREKTIEVVRTNPYRLIDDIERVGFKTADEIAMNAGIVPKSRARAEAAVMYVLQEISNDGHTVTPRALAAHKTALLLDPDTNEKDRKAEPNPRFLDIADEALTTLIGLGRLVECDDGISEHYFAETESDIATLVRGLASSKPRKPVEPHAEAVDAAELNTEAVILSERQQEAVRTLLNESMGVLTGGPGVGKTTVTRAILTAFEAAGLKVALAAPTGRAAKRMAEVTGREAKTIHRLLEYNRMRFQRDEMNPLEVDAVIIDECSMVDLSLMHALLRAVPSGCRFIMVGDADQLPSVGAGSVLRDVIQSGVVPVARLTEIFRQAESSQIVMGAHAILTGRMPVTTRLSSLPEVQEASGEVIFVEKAAEVSAKALVHQVCEYIPRKFGFDPMKDIQVLVPMKKSDMGTEVLNRQLQGALNPKGESLRHGDTVFRVGDRVMQTKNDYDREIYNGDIGFVSEVSEVTGVKFRVEDGREITASGSELEQLMLAYATTVHKAQGSEYPVVVIGLVDAHYVMLARNIFYTALTRARKLVVLVGTRRAVQQAIRNDKHEERRTMLGKHLGASRMS